MFCRHVFRNISGAFRGISRFFGNFAGPRPREISEALPIQETVIVIKQTDNNVAMHHEKADEALQN